MPDNVSVILPIYNAEKYLSEAVESVYGQKIPLHELIIVDDGSTDNGIEKIALFRKNIRYVYQSNRGPAGARNTGLSMATGDLIAFIDADDKWPKGKLKNQLQLLSDFPEVDIVWGRSQYEFENEELAHLYNGTKSTEGTVFNAFLGAALFRKRVFERVGLFDSTLRFGEDWDWLNRAEELEVPILKTEECSLIYRVHTHNMTSDKDEVNFHTVKLLKKKLDRKLNR